MKIVVDEIQLPPFEGGNSNIQERPGFSERYQVSITMQDQSRIGLVGDIHHNTLLLKEILDKFVEMGVNCLFLLGDYSSLPQKVKGVDHADLRYRQFSKVVELTKSFQERTASEVVMILGNHEIESWYYSPDSTSRAKIRTLIEKARSWGWNVPPDPFAGYEFRDGAYVRVFSNLGAVSQNLDSLRTFNLAHSVSKDLTSVLYQGFPTERDRMDRLRSNLLRQIGSIWQTYIDKAASEASSRWSSFLSDPTDELILDITDGIRRGLSYDALLDHFTEIEEGNAKPIRWLTSQPAEIIDRLAWFWMRFNETSFWHINYRVEPPDGFNDDLIYELFETQAMMGAGAHYTVSGHFHADLGQYQISEYYNSIGIAGAGFESGKVISKELTCYVIEASQLGDTLYRLSAAAHMDGRTSEEVDLSGSIRSLL